MILTTLPTTPTDTYALFFFNDTATTEIYTLSLHDALPISTETAEPEPSAPPPPVETAEPEPSAPPTATTETAEDRKSTRLNSSHPSISYAVFCLKKKKIAFKSAVTFINSPDNTLNYSSSDP